MFKNIELFIWKKWLFLMKILLILQVNVLKINIALIQVLQGSVCKVIVLFYFEMLIKVKYCLILSIGYINFYDTIDTNYQSRILSGKLIKCGIVIGKSVIE